MVESRVLKVIVDSQHDFLVDAATGEVLTPRADMPILLVNVVRVDLVEYRRWDPTPGVEIHAQLVDLIRQTPFGELREPADHEARAAVDADLALERISFLSRSDR
jgi:hypothetical protein